MTCRCSKGLKLVATYSATLAEDKTTDATLPKSGAGGYPLLGVAVDVPEGATLRYSACVNYELDGDTPGTNAVARIRDSVDGVMMGASEVPQDGGDGSMNLLAQKVGAAKGTRQVFLDIGVDNPSGPDRMSVQPVSLPNAEGACLIVDVYVPS